MMRHSVVMAVAMMAVGLTGCDWGKGGEVSTDLIHIPATARESGPRIEAYPEVTFAKPSASLGIITEGSQVEHTFHFSNTGNAPLILTDVSTSCGCTLAENWTKSPLSPGEKGTIKVRFDSRGRVGSNRKEIFVVTNAIPSTTTLTLEAEVIGPK